MNSSILSALVLHDENTSSINLLHTNGLLSLCPSISFSVLANEMLTKGYGHFCRHGCSISLYIIFSIELECIFSKNWTEHFPKEPRWNGRVRVVEFFV